MDLFRLQDLLQCVFIPELRIPVDVKIVTDNMHNNSCSVNNVGVAIYVKIFKACNFLQMAQIENFYDICSRQNFMFEDRLPINFFADSLVFCAAWLHVTKDTYFEQHSIEKSELEVSKLPLDISHSTSIITVQK